MQDRLPPLTALRAFDAAARHMSFAKAAEELHVTPAALSFQIKSLEEHLGTQVFRRLNRAVELTDAGKALAPGVADGFRILAGAWRAAEKVTDNHTLTVTAGPAFTAKWLAPRLYEFAQTHPDVELRFAASLKMMDLARDGIDVAIRFGRGLEDDHYVLPLAEEWVCPVMTPDMATRYTTPQSLRDAPLIFDDSIRFLNPPMDWGAWFKVMGIDHAPTHGPRFSQADHAVDAALAGVGVVLARRALVVKDLADGRLVAPFPTALKTGARFRFLCAKGAETRPHIAAFRDWIVSEIDKTRHITEAMTLVTPS
ncbi:transcriptional regulator GcvA [Tateyamaria sp. SN6-1]|uniref:transcriptional regulator GcvA n=1 Tax=Tateyamaria sp. SN6-1 TaxID=3092148 RepID=UPI0039F4E21B